MRLVESATLVRRRIAPHERRGCLCASPLKDAMHWTEQSWTYPETVDTRVRGYKARGESIVTNRQTFTKEFKNQAIGLVVEQDRAPADVAKALGVKVGTLKWWLREHRRTDVTTQAIEKSTLRRRVRELESQLQRVTMEREINKTAPPFCIRGYASATSATSPSTIIDAVLLSLSARAAGAL